ncbi:DNA methyltransferase [Aliarcobacter butzleri]|uniref:DNA methyltransferase n=1 Tax=Aliarcobacter butzleri TaxID=28197 RepID=UPI0021B4D284|nr:DNA methyltransferase [Aliarcobacter butzleri]MCT7615657.1 DNA methyltransferase [Aliarcobacter butzleri]
MEYTVYKGNSTTITEKLLNTYENKFKLIYLDPPYNTKRIRGARKSYGDTNNKWDEFITPILKNSFSLLNNEGFICISINQMELFNLKNILDSIFGEDCFIGLFPVKIRHKDRQLMINATFHDLYEYLIIYRKRKTTRFFTQHLETKTEKFIYDIQTFNDFPKIEYINNKKVEIYYPNEFKIIKKEPNLENLRKYIIAGKIATANWSGEFFENHLRKYGNNLLIKVYDLEKEGLGYRWFETQNEKRKSGVYYQSSLTAGKPVLPSNEIDLTEIVPNIYKEGGEGCDFKDSKKPEEFIQLILKMTTQAGDLVGDFFSGSGTTIAQSIKMNRSCIVSDNNDNSIRITLNRLKNLKLGKDICKKCYQFDYKILGENDD